jgi:hypothetical protein
VSAEAKKVGDALGLEVQLGDGDNRVAQTRVFADLRQLDGTLIGTEFELIHVGNGKYTDETRVMPDFEKISVSYYIRRADGTTPSNFFNPNFLSEQFVKDVTGQLIEDNLSAFASSTSIEGAVDGDLELVGVVEDEDIIGIVDSDDSLTGVVNDES